MRILIAHNRYQEQGGEDRVVEEEAAMLARHGHEVETFLVDNDAIHGGLTMVKAAIDSFYSTRSAREISRCLDSFAPNILHVHNFMPRLSPSIFFSAKRSVIPVVQTLHNYRLICANAVLFRDGHLCEECPRSGSFVPGILHACYRGSALGSAVVGGTIAVHAAMGTWRNRVDRYIALTDFAAAQLAQSRVPAERVRIKPNFVADAAVGQGGGGYGLFAGRLSPEKGLSTLIEADAQGLLKVPVWIAGEGVLLPELQAASQRIGSQLRVLGPVKRAELQEYMRNAEVLIVPSLWYEPCPMVVIEALAVGLPVACSRLGGLPGIIGEDVGGVTFEAGSGASLAAAVNRFAESSDESRKLRQGARRRFEEEFSEARNYKRLRAIYDELVPKAS